MKFFGVHSVLQKVITCFENSKGSGNLLDQDRFVLLQSAMVDKALMCPDLKYDKLKKSIQNSGQFCAMFEISILLHNYHTCLVLLAPRIW